MIQSHSPKTLYDIAYELYMDSYISKNHDPLSLYHFQYSYINKINIRETSYIDIKNFYDRSFRFLRKLKLIEIENVKP